MDNIIKMGVNEMADLLTPLYAASSKKGLDKTGKETMVYNFSKIPSIMLWGPPGIGKSQGVDDVKRRLATLTGKRINKVDARLLLFNPVDLRGIPSKVEVDVILDGEIQKNEDGSHVKESLAKWLKPQIFQMSDSPEVINILMLDEISAAPLSVQAAAYQITLDRTVGEHKLPDNCIIVAAGNRVTDKSVAYKMPKALANRMTHIEIACNVDDWKKWAIPAGIDSKIIAYINYINSALYQFDPSKDDLAFASPRTWEMVDTYLKLYKSIDAAFSLIAGTVGMGMATEFKAYTSVFDKLPDIKAIYNGLETRVPSGPDVLYALSAALVSKAPKANKKQLANLLNYTRNMPAEYATLTIKDCVSIDKVRNNMLMLPEWIDWSKKYKNFIM